jgi:hypothetical protein
MMRLPPPPFCIGPDKAVNINARTQFLKRCGSRGGKLSGWEWEWEWEWE